jgi:hypothetical protein
MKAWKLAIAATVAVVAAALITASAFAYMGGRGFYSPYGTNANGAYSAYPSGMMSGYQYGYPAQPNLGTQTTPSYPYQYGGRGCMGSSYAAPATATSSPITINTAVTVAKNYLTSLNNPDLAIDEVEEYTQNFYVLYYEKSTGYGAFEMLIDKYSGSIYPEMGPNMMWNTKYGMMSGGMMGWVRGTPSATMQVTADQAKTYAQQFLDANLLGTTIGDIDTFYGYYHIDVLQANNTYGMLSVNGYTGQVWYHTWHGTFVQRVQL